MSDSPHLIINVARGVLMCAKHRSFVAKDIAREVQELREALLLYHEAWNGSEGDWRAEMRKASKNAERILR